MLRGRLIPWPWSLNVAGTPQRYATRAEACAGLHRALAHTPANRIDAGLGQVNLGYHAHRYTQPCELLDPYRNLAVAAEILREQHTPRSEEHTSELQSLMRISYAVFCLKKKNKLS